MHAGGLDAVERTDGARQLAFERPQIVDVLHEARGAERVRLVENLVADAAALGQAVFGQRHAQPGDAVTRRMRKAKQPMSAMVTAPIAAMRGAPSVLANSTRPCTESFPQGATL